MTAKTPQEKKRLSLSKDRRNTYGQHDKASRRCIPLNKAKSIRADRHAQDQALAAVKKTAIEDSLVVAELAVHSSKPRQWRKFPDEPLQVFLARKNARGSGG
jgi:hypothetical protein